MFNEIQKFRKIDKNKDVKFNFSNSLTIENVSFSFDENKIFENLNFEVNNKSIFGIKGKKVIWKVNPNKFNYRFLQP